MPELDFEDLSAYRELGEAKEMEEALALAGDTITKLKLRNASMLVSYEHMAEMVVGTCHEENISLLKAIKSTAQRRVEENE